MDASPIHNPNKNPNKMTKKEKKMMWIGISLLLAIPLTILVFHDIHAYSFLFHLKEHINIRIMSFWQQRYFYSQPCKKGEDLVSITDPKPPPPTTEITENPRPKGSWVFWRKF